MNKYTAGYTHTNNNFVIQNLKNDESDSNIRPLLLVLKNILQRGCPTVMSNYLLQALPFNPQDANNQPFAFTSKSNNIWVNTIKGDEQRNYYPAKDFLETIIPNEFGDYSFVQSMIIPEIGINEIVGYENPSFIGQQVDFYLPQALLVIEIDGQQHKLVDAQRVSDNTRDNYLRRYGIETIRIDTKELKNGLYKNKVNQILARLIQFSDNLTPYKRFLDTIDGNNHYESYTQDMLLTAIIRFQILLVELLLRQNIRLGEKWRFNIKVCEPDIFTDDLFVKLAIEDVLVWLDNLYLLKEKTHIPDTKYEIKVNSPDAFKYSSEAINIDFSVIKKYTDENTLNPNVIFLRGDYFDYNEATGKQVIGQYKNYFRVSTDSSINYNITDKDIPTLEFFLQNIFRKQKFRDGQFSIIANALNLRDTIGLLPTGGGKSLCYQLPCLLQPAINFVVCPIKSLMYDQYDNMRKKDVSITNINYVSSDMDVMEKGEIQNNFGRGKYLLLWVSPERFQINGFRDALSSIANNHTIAYAVIDEVHCLSEWGHDFRTSYLNLAKTIDRISPVDKYGEGAIKYIGLTATASVNVLKDIKIEFSRKKQQLEEDNIKSLLDYSRKELEFEVINVAENSNKQRELLKVLSDENIPNTLDKITLIFTPTVNGDNGCYPLYKLLNAQFPRKVMWYAGQSPKEQGITLYDNKVLNRIKTEIQRDFKEDKYQILCSTKAFGMGIDKDNIFYTIHYGIPGSIESLYQEAGRAGRWDKNLPQNKSKKGKCFVLYTSVPAQLRQVEDAILAPSTSISRMRNLHQQVGSAGNDSFTHLFLFLKNHIEIDLEFTIIKGIVDTFFQENSQINIYYDQVSLFLQPYKKQLGITRKEDEYELFEKGIYRLCLLGVVEDWSRDFVNSFTVHFSSISDKHVIESVRYYISKYDNSEDVPNQIHNVTQPLCTSTFDKAVWYLLDWIFRYITNNRKQSLKGLIELCRNFTTSGDFKQRIDSYFIFNESTFILQHVAEHPDDIEKWFEPFYSNGVILTDVEFKKLRDRLMRFLESYHFSSGLNFISGFVRLFLNDFDDNDGRTRFENAIESIKNSNDKGKKEIFVSHTIRLLTDSHLTTEQLFDACTSIIKYLPELTIPLAEEFKLPQLLNEHLSDKIKKFKQLNIQLYEEFGRI